jgi:hypothetical protein
MTGSLSKDAGSHRAALLAAGLFMAAACTSTEHTASELEGVHVDTVGGVVYVRNPMSPSRWQTDSLFSIGTALADRPDAFGRVASVVSDRSGRIYVADPLANQIQVFGSDGSYIRSLGRKGQGPGEFESLYSLAWLGDTLAVLDPRNARIQLLTIAGEPAGLFRHQALSGEPRVIRLYQTGDEEIATIGVKPRERTIERLIIRFGTAGPRDTVPFPDNPFPADDPTAGGTSILCETPDGGLTFFQVPYAPRHWAVPAPGGLTAVTWTADYRIALLDAAGDTSRVIERQYDQIATSPVAWKLELGEYRTFLEERPDARCRPADPDRPPFRPAIHLIFFDALGRLWVEVETPQGRALDVYDAAGRLVGTLTAPPRVESVIPWADRDRLYTVTADELGVFRVHVFAISAP